MDIFAFSGQWGIRRSGLQVVDLIPTFDYSIGIKGKVKLWKDIALTGGAEGGLLLIKNPAPGLDNIKGFDWELSHNFFIGLNYRL